MFEDRKARLKEARLEAKEARRRETIEDVTTFFGLPADIGPLERLYPSGVPNNALLNSLVRNIAASNLNLKYFGYEMARQLAAALPRRTETVARPVSLSWKPSTQADMETDWVAHWCAELKVPVIFHRKLWEFAYLLQALFENGLLVAGARGLGFGCGEEPLPSYFTSKGIAVTMTDLAADEAQAAGWAATGQLASSTEQAFRADLVDRAVFDRLTDFRNVDMNAIPADLTDYDFCWSICALEHLGSIERGLAFVENAMATLRPGGLAVHTTEFNIDPRGETIDNWPTVLFKREHMTDLARRLEAAGHVVAPLDFDLGDKPMDRFIDLPPWGHDMPPEYSRWHGDGAHLKVAVDGFVSTCFGLVVRKAG